MSVSTKRLGMAALATALMAFGGQAVAQNRPAQAPAQAAPPAGAPQGPTRVELQPAQGDWTKVCGKDQSVNKEMCFTTRYFGTSADQPPVLALAVYDVKGDDTKIVRFLLPIGLQISPGFRFAVDKGAALEGKYEICFPNGCFAESKVKQPVVEQLKKGTNLSVSVKNQVAAEVIFSMPLAGFGKAFDGPAMDPQVLAQKEQELQQAIQKQAEEQRKALEAGGGAAPAPAAAPK